MSEPSAPRTLEIALFARGKFLGTRTYTSSPVTIGRSPKASLRLNDPAVSAEHAVVTITARTCLIEDLGSSNGTLVGGQRIESHMIRPTDEIAIGHYTLRFAMRDAQDSLDVTHDFDAGPTRVTAEIASVPAQAAPAPAPAPAPASTARTTTPAAPRPPAKARQVSKPWEETPTKVSPPTPEDLRIDEGLLVDPPTLGRRPDLPGAAPPAAAAPVAAPPAEPRRAGTIKRAPRVSEAPATQLKAAPQMPVRAPAPAPAAEPKTIDEDLSTTSPGPLIPDSPAIHPITEAYGVEESARGAVRNVTTAAAVPPVPTPAPAPALVATAPVEPPLPAPRPQRTPPLSTHATAPNLVPPPPRLTATPALTTPDAPPMAPMPVERPAAAVQPAAAPASPSADVPLIVPTFERSAEVTAPTYTTPVYEPTPSPELLAAAVPLPASASGGGPDPALPASGDGRSPDQLIDDEDDDSTFVPSFSLVHRLLGQQVAIPQLAHAAVELITHRNERVVDVTHLWPGQRVRFPGGMIADHRRPGELVVSVRGVAIGELYSMGGLRNLADVEKRTSVRSFLHLTPAHVASLDRGVHGTMHVRFVPGIRVAGREPLSFQPSREGIISSASSFCFHILVFVWLAFFGSEREVDALPTEGRFAKVDIKDLELEPPPPPPPPAPPPPEEKVEEITVPEPEVAPPPPKPEPAPAPKAKPSKAPRQVASEGSPTAPPKPSKQTQALLNSLNVSDASPSASTTSVTNLDAVKVSRGTSAGFKTADTVGKLPGNQLALPGGVSDGRIDTKSGAEVARGNVGKVTTAPDKGGPVRGTVARAPAREVDVQGELDRALVLKVVNEHMREVQGCYERKLVQDRDLAGKIVFEWVITTTGAVSVVRVKFSDMRNSDVTTCIQGAIKSWSFPKPTGGPATIVYPFVFSTLGG